MLFRSCVYGDLETPGKMANFYTEKPKFSSEPFSVRNGAWLATGFQVRVPGTSM